MPFKKRRIIRSPNKNQQKSQRNQVSLPPLRSFFPEVERLVLDIEFLSRAGHILREDHFEYNPGDSVDFISECPGGCGDGEINLQSKIESVVRSRQETGEGRAQCANTLYSTTDLCGCEVKCKLSVEYRSEAVA
ncbi:MAG: hypothetical protein ACKVQC_09360 [Elusimicrobiota bacterium]